MNGTRVDNNQHDWREHIYDGFKQGSDAPVTRQISCSDNQRAESDAVGIPGTGQLSCSTCEVLILPVHHTDGNTEILIDKGLDVFDHGIGNRPENDQLTYALHDRCRHSADYNHSNESSHRPAYCE